MNTLMPTATNTSGIQATLSALMSISLVCGILGVYFLSDRKIIAAIILVSVSLLSGMAAFWLGTSL